MNKTFPGPRRSGFLLPRVLNDKVSSPAVLPTRLLLLASTLAFLSASALAPLASQGGAITDWIRKRDWRSREAQKHPPPPAPATFPLNNVPDMPGWSTDLEGALAFSRENGMKTYVLIDSRGSSPRARAALSDAGVIEAFRQNPRVVVPIDSLPAALAPYASNAREGVAILLVIDSSGAVVNRNPAPVSPRAAMALLGASTTLPRESTGRSRAADAGAAPDQLPSAQDQQEPRHRHAAEAPSDGSVEATTRPRKPAHEPNAGSEPKKATSTPKPPKSKAVARKPQTKPALEATAEHEATPSAPNGTEAEETPAAALPAAKKRPAPVELPMPDPS